MTGNTEQKKKSNFYWWGFGYKYGEFTFKDLQELYLVPELWAEDSVLTLGVYNNEVSMTMGDLYELERRGELTITRHKHARICWGLFETDYPLFSSPIQEHILEKIDAAIEEWEKNGGTGVFHYQLPKDEQDKRVAA